MDPIPGEDPDALASHMIETGISTPDRQGTIGQGFPGLHNACPGRPATPTRDAAFSTGNPHPSPMGP
ncbi:hypothetical protein IMZ48_24405 [Candidatus Bathyarchaeota archaeon]|nr:hypothetical protein [Candidatus Bathyarchaeota archaeon]